MNKKKVTICIMSASLALSMAGCSSDSKLTNQKVKSTMSLTQQTVAPTLEVTATPALTATPEPTTATTPEPTNTTEATKEIEAAEKEMEITKEKKEEFISKYGQDVYITGLMYCSDVLQINKNSEVGNESFDKYRDEFKVEDVTLTSTYDKHKIPANYIKVDNRENRDTVIFIHGQGCTRFTNMGIAEIFLRQGYNILTFDLRSSGDNQAKYTTYGALEQYDVLDCVDYIEKKLDKDNKIIIWAGSYGGSVASVTLGSEQANKKIDAAILDSPLDSMDTLLKSYYYSNGESDTELSEVEDSCDKFLNYFWGFSLDDTDGKVAIAKTKVPTLVFCSKGDEVLPMGYSQSLYNSIKLAKKQIKVYGDNVGHCMGVDEDPDGYMKTVKNFIKKNCKK